MKGWAIDAAKHRGEKGRVLRENRAGSIRGFRSAATKVLRSYARDRVIRKRLPSDLGGGTIFCSPDAMLSTWLPGWKSTQALHLFDWARHLVRAGEVVWDIGANQGLFSFASLAAAGPKGHVVAFEPDPFLVGLLHRSRRAQAAETRLDILPVAVAGDVDLAAFTVAKKDRALNHLTALVGNPHCGGERDRFAVVTVSLEWLADRVPSPTLIKIDVEGAELAVLQHAGRGFLERLRPRLIVEVADENAAPVTDILRFANYRLFDADAPGHEIRRASWNTLAIPSEAM